MLSHLKQLVKTQESNIILTLGIILVALASFGIGRLTAPKNHNQPIVIQQPNTASIQQSIKLDKPEIIQGRFVGSSNSNKYHSSECPWAKKIASENQIWFDSEQEAQNAGYVRCGSFEKYAP